MVPQFKCCHLIISTGFPEAVLFSKILCKTSNLHFINIGEVLKTVYKSEDGDKIKMYMGKGLPFSSKLLAEMLESRFVNESRNVLLQGFPKDAEQMGLLRDLLDRNGFKLCGIWHFAIQNTEHYISDLKQSADPYILKFGVNEDRIRNQAKDCEEAFRSLTLSGNLAPASYLIPVDSRKKFSEREAEILIRMHL